MTNINIEIPDELHRQLKIEAATQQQSLKNLIIKLLEKRVGGDTT